MAFNDLWIVSNLSAQFQNLIKSIFIDFSDCSKMSPIDVSPKTTSVADMVSKGVLGLAYGNIWVESQRVD